MDNLTEKSPYKDLFSAWKEVNDYGERAANAKTVKDALKKNDIVFRRVNTPKKSQALYIIIKTKRRMFHIPFLIVEGSEGRSFVAMQDEFGMERSLTVIHSHAINRYMERHGWDGSLEECEYYILESLWVMSINVDKYTKETIVYFDGGVFLGCEKDKVCHLNTYVANQHLYPNQRLKSRKLQESIEELFSKL